MNLVEQIILFCEKSGVWGVFLLAFTDAFISPIVPDIVLLPLSFANPTSAIYYSAIATVASILGSFVGYGIGHKYGPKALKRFVPDKHVHHLRNLVDKYGAWGVFAGAMAPIPYKFVAITAGSFGIDLRLFIFATVLGRAKRFLIIGIAVYYFGPHVINIIHQYSNNALWLFLGVSIVGGVFYYLRKKAKAKKINGPN